MAFATSYHTTSLEKLLQDWIKEASDKTAISQIVMKTVFEKLLEAERDAFLKYPYGTSSCGGNKRNGYYARMVENLSGSFTLSVPRDRLGKFQPFLLEVIAQEQERMDAMAYTLYTKGLPTRDVEDVLKKCYGASYSPQAISDITGSFQEYREAWHERPLDADWYVLYIDAVHLAIRRDSVANEAVCVVLGLKPDLTREILGIYNIPQESASGWQDILDDLKKRGAGNTLLIAADGLSGLQDVAHRVYPAARFQSCILHKQRNVLKRVRVSDRQEAGNDLKTVFDLAKSDDTSHAAQERLNVFVKKWAGRYPSLLGVFAQDLRPSLFTYLSFPFSIRRMIYTTNWIERFQRDIRKGTRQRLSFPNPDSALNLVWAIAMDREEKTYRHQVTAILPAKDELDSMMAEMKAKR